MRPKKLRSSISHSVTVFLLAAMTLSGQSADYKIAADLMKELTDDAAATRAVFVVFSARAELKDAPLIADRATRGRVVMERLQATANTSQAGVRAELQRRGVSFTPFWVHNSIFIRMADLALVRALSERQEVAAIIKEPVFTIPINRTDGGAGTQAVGSNIAKIRADLVWPTTKGQGIVVSNIDTGVRFTHQALISQYRGNLGGGNFAHVGNWFDPGGGCDRPNGPAGSNPPPLPCDDDNHGSHTMGTMVGDDGGTNQIGVAPGAKWIACKACGPSGCPGSSLMSCAQFMVAPNSNPALRPDVVNNSWGGGMGDPWYQNFVQSWRAAGIFPAFSNGNSGPNCQTSGSPGDYPDSFSSGATDINDLIANFSSRGPSPFGNVIKPDVSAPGVSVRSSFGSSNTAYANLNGTSMASPHTAGTVALIWAAVPALRGNIAATELALTSTAVPITTTQNCGGTANQVPNNTFGFGRIDAFNAAIGSLTRTPPRPSSVQIDSPTFGASMSCPASVSFSGRASDGDARNIGSSIQWTDNRVPIGNGRVLTRTYSCSDIGTHVITARVRDSHGLNDLDTVAIRIVDSRIPRAPKLSSRVEGSTVQLSVTDVSNATSLKIERRGEQLIWVLVKVLGSGQSEYKDRAPGAGTWQYRVSAHNQYGGSAPSNLEAIRTF